MIVFVLCGVVIALTLVIAFDLDYTETTARNVRGNTSPLTYFVGFT